MFPLRPLLVGLAGTAAALFLAFVGVILYSSQHAGAPTATMAPPQAEYSVRLPANIVPEDVIFVAMTSLSAYEDKAAVYKIESTDITTGSVTELGRKLGFTGQAKRSYDGSKIEMTQGSGADARQLTVWTASGAVEYGYVEPEKMYPSTWPLLPSQSDAALIAYDFLQQADLLPAGYHSLASIKDETTVAAGGGYSFSKAAAAAPPAAEPAAPAAPTPITEDTSTEAAAPSTPPARPAPVTTPGGQAPTYWLVEFPYFVDGAVATGPGSKIEVSVGDRGQVVDMQRSWRQMSPYRTDNIISEQQAFQELIQGEGSLEVPLDCKQVIVDGVQLKYWLDPPSEEQDYVIPVYEFTGRCLDQNGKTLEDFTGWTPALPTN
jgi:hypothetical protein